MTSDDDITMTGERLRDALGAAADLMMEDERPASPPAAAQFAPGEPGGRRPGRAWLVPLTAAAAVVAVVLGSVLAVGHLGGSARTAGGTTPASQGTSAPPEYYLALNSTAHGWPLQVHRTSDGAVTASEKFPGTMPQGGYLTADDSGRAFYIATFASCTKATPVTRFYRITINGSGQFSGYQAVGSPVSGTVIAYAVSADGSQMAYTLQSGWCEDPHGLPGPMTSIHVMNLSTGTVRTWQNSATASGADRVTSLLGGLSWTPDGRSVVAMAHWGSKPGQPNDALVFRLDTTGSGGSIQADSQVLLTQDQNCVSCVQQAIAGPDGSITAVALQYHGGRGEQLVVSISHGTTRLLYRAAAPPDAEVDFTTVLADPSGKWVITWPPDDLSKPSWQSERAGWIRDGKLVSLPGTTLVYPNAIAW